MMGRIPLDKPSKNGFKIMKSVPGCLIATESAKSASMAISAEPAQSTITTVVTMSTEVVEAMSSESTMTIAVSMSIGVTVMSGDTQNCAGNTIVGGSPASASNMVGNGIDTKLTGSIVPVYGSLMATVNK